MVVVFIYYYIRTYGIINALQAKQLELRDRMDLASYLLKPVQRMGKYALLLQQLMKMAKGDTEHLRLAENMVRFQLRHGNDLLAMDSLRECDVNLKEQGRLLRQNEFLVWQGKGKKCLRQVFLFEELILFSKARRFPDQTVSVRDRTWPPLYSSGYVVHGYNWPVALYNKRTVISYVFFFYCHRIWTCTCTRTV